MSTLVFVRVKDVKRLVAAGWVKAAKQPRFYRERVDIARKMAGWPHAFDGLAMRRVYPSSRHSVLMHRPV